MRKDTGGKAKKPDTKRKRDSSPSEEALLRRIKRLEALARTNELGERARNVLPTPYVVPEYAVVNGHCELPSGQCLVFDEAQQYFLVREEYATLHNVLRNTDTKDDIRARCVLITGNPGIGKTVALEDLLRRELKAKHFEHIMCVAQRGILHFTRRAAKGKWAAIRYAWPDAERFGSLFQERAVKPRMLLLHDLKSTNSRLKYQGELVGSLFGAFRVTTAFASSPDQQNTKDLKKVFMKRTTFYSACWSVDECRQVYRLLDPPRSDAEFDAQFYVTGGVVRHLLGDVGDVQEDMKRTIAGLDFDEDLWAERASASVVSHYRTLLQQRDDKANSGAVIERLALAELQQYPLKARLGPLFRGGESKKSPAKSTLTLAKKPVVKRFAGRDATNVKKIDATTLYVPEACQFPFVNFLLVYPDGNVDLFKTTAAATHAPSSSTVAGVLKSLKTNKLKAKRLIWIRPQSSGVQTQEVLSSNKKTKKETSDAENPTQYDQLRQYRWEL